MEEIKEKEIIKVVLTELKNMQIISNKPKDPYANTITLLKRIKQLPEAISKLEEHIKDVEKDVEQSTIKSSNVILREIDGTYIHRDETAESYINELKNLVMINKKYIKYVDNILDKFKEDKYYRIIELMYFEKKTQEETAEILNCDSSTVKRNRNRLVNDISLMLFPTTFINNLK